ncbi:MAG: hypothetical protein ACJAYE_002227 [Candidatus Azotimanducaceae bacterium]|jgi:hypothetical protein
MDQHDNNHWLVRASTIRLLWIGGSLVLGLTVVAQIFIPIKGHFGTDDWFGFGAIYGFVVCLLMVLFAKGLGFVLKRKEDFYDPGEPIDGAIDGVIDGAVDGSVKGKSETSSDPHGDDT